ncbi:hypothetical protein AB0I72_19065 [Nocardiopsis sp. NPDC049922]
MDPDDDVPFTDEERARITEYVLSLDPLGVQLLAAYLEIDLDQH